MASTQSYSTNLGLPKVPTAKDEDVFRELYIVYNALNALAAQLDTLTGVAISVASSAVGNKQTKEAGVALTVGTPVFIDSTNVLLVADSTLNRPCHGICSIAAAASEVAEFTLFGPTSYADASLTPGKKYYLQAAGTVSLTPNTTSAQIKQVVGFALAADLMYFFPDSNWSINP